MGRGMSKDQKNLEHERRVRERERIEGEYKNKPEEWGVCVIRNN